MAVVAGWKSDRRSDALAATVVEALRRHAPAINQAADLRSVTVSVKFKTGAALVRAVVVTVESESTLLEG